MFRQLSSGFLGSILPLLLTGLASCSFAEQPVAMSTSSVLRERSLLAESYAKEKLWGWQKRLGLQDWNVVLEVVRSTELKPKTLGNIHWDTDKKSAVIRVLDPADYKMAQREMLED